MTNRLLLFLLVCLLAISSNTYAEINPYNNIKYVPNIDRKQLRKPTGLMIIRVPDFNLNTFKAAEAKAARAIHHKNSQITAEHVQIGMYNFQAPPNPDEDREIRLLAQKMGAELVFVLDDGKHPFVHAAVFYGIKKP